MYIVCFVCIVGCFFFFKQKTAYEMRISDWSSDVCSSDLAIWPLSLKAGRSRERRKVWAFHNRPYHARYASCRMSFNACCSAGQAVDWNSPQRGKRCLRRPAGRLPPLRTYVASFPNRMAKPCSGSRRSEEHTSELQSLMRISYAVFCLKKKKLKQ